MPDVTKLPLAHQTMFADLAARCMDAAFDEQFPENGSFVRMEVKGRAYWYYSGYAPDPTGSGQGTRRKLYVGPADDPAIASRVAAFADIKTNYRERRQMVQSLTAAGLPSPTGFVGDITEILWKAGFFRLRGVLIGTLAFQTYSGLLGVGMRGSALMTGDADFALFHSIASAVGDEMPGILGLLQDKDPTFRPVPHLGRQTVATRFKNARGFDVEFLTPNRGSDANQGKPAPMKALGDVGAEPLRFLDFLIHAPVRSVLLHKAGIPVTVPAPERYAVHKLIVATLRKTDSNGRQKARKDVVQAGMLFEALDMEGRSIDLGLAWTEAWDRGPRWQQSLVNGTSALDRKSVDILRQAVIQACREERRTACNYGFPPDGDNASDGGASIAKRKTMR